MAQNGSILGVETKGLVGRDHKYEVTYRIIMDSEGPFHYRIFTVSTEAELTKGQIEVYLGRSNIKELHVDLRGKHEVAVELRLNSDEFTHVQEIVAVSPMSIAEEIRELLPEKHVVEVTVVNAVDLGGYGWRR